MIQRSLLRITINRDAYVPLQRMPDYRCEVCSRAFSTSSNRSRHMRSHHGMTAEHGDDDESNESDDDMTIGSDDDDDRETDSDDEGDGSEAEDTEDAQWTTIVSKACDNVSFGPGFEKPTDALKEPFLSEIVSEMANFVERRLQFAKVI